MKHNGSCHCGAIAFEVEGDIETAIDCNCSMCRRRGGLLWFAPRSAFQLTTPVEALGTYTFNRHVIHHHFCKRCGIATHGDGVGPDGREMTAVNVRCIEAIDLKALSIQEFDGRSY
jgi:hypothetical protein